MNEPISLDRIVRNILTFQVKTFRFASFSMCLKEKSGSSSESTAISIPKSHQMTFRSKSLSAVSKES